MDDLRRRTPNSGTLVGMDLETWCDLDLAHLLIFGTHPDLPDQTVKN